MQGLSYINKSVIENLKNNYDNFNELEIIDNELVFKNKKINLYQFNLLDLFNNYSLLKKNIKYLKSEDFYNIVELHIIFLYTDKYKNLKLFYYYLENLFKYEDYLNSNLQNILNNYVKQFIDLEKNENLNINQKEALNKYHQLKVEKQNLIDDAYNRYKNFINAINNPSASVESGFVNAILLIVIVLCVGVITAVFLISRI